MRANAEGIVFPIYCRWQVRTGAEWELVSGAGSHKVGGVGGVGGGTGPPLSSCNASDIQEARWGKGGSITSVRGKGQGL